jgi:hypothetical protein
MLSWEIQPNHMLCDHRLISLGGESSTVVSAIPNVVNRLLLLLSALLLATSLGRLLHDDSNALRARGRWAES